MDIQQCNTITSPSVSLKKKKERETPTPSSHTEGEWDMLVLVYATALLSFGKPSSLVHDYMKPSGSKRYPTELTIHLGTIHSDEVWILRIGHAFICHPLKIFDLIRPVLKAVMQVHWDSGGLKTR